MAKNRRRQVDGRRLPVRPAAFGEAAATDNQKRMLLESPEADVVRVVEGKTLR